MSAELDAKANIPPTSAITHARCEVIKEFMAVESAVRRLPQDLWAQFNAEVLAMAPRVGASWREGDDAQPAHVLLRDVQALRARVRSAARQWAEHLL